MAWEWQDGFRSWLGPLPYILIFTVLKFFGVQGGPLPIYAARLFAALVSVSALWVLHRWLFRLGFSYASRFAAVVFFALHPAMVLWGVSTLTDHFSLNVLILVLPFLFQEPASFRSGFLFGLTFLARFQLIALLPGYGVFLLWRKTPFREILRFGFGYLACTSVLGVADWITWGAPYKSLSNQLFYGVKISQNYGVEPWWKYFYFLGGNLSIISVIALIGMGIFALNNRKWRPLFIFSSLPALSFFLVHSCLPHKEGRFILPIYAIFPIWIAIFFDHWKLKWESFQHRKYTVFAFTAATMALAILSFSRTGNRSLYLSEVNVFDLETATFRDGKLLRLRPEKRCILTVTHNWSWSHGYLTQGTELRFEEIKEEQPRHPSECPYAWVYRFRKEKFLKNAPEKWEFMMASKISTYDLYRQSTPTN